MPGNIVLKMEQNRQVLTKCRIVHINQDWAEVENNPKYIL